MQTLSKCLCSDLSPPPLLGFFGSGTYLTRKKEDVLNDISSRSGHIHLLGMNVSLIFNKARDTYSPRNGSLHTYVLHHVGTGAVPGLAISQIVLSYRTTRG